MSLEVQLQTISSALDFAKAQQMTIVDASNTARLATYIVRNQKRVARPIRGLWRAMAELVTPEEAKRAIRVGGLPVEWRTEWERTITSFVREDFNRILEGVFIEVGEAVARRVNALPRKEFEFRPTQQRVIREIEAHGGDLITRLLRAQLEAIKAALLEYVVAEGLTPFELAKRLRNLVGLTEGYANAVLRLERELTAAGLARDAIAKQIEKYAAFLHKVRAEMIARTELSFGYNRGQLEAILQAREEGWLAGEVVKIWTTTGQTGRVCEDCEELDGQALPLDGTFSAGDHEPVESPPLHPQCGCSLTYETRR